MYALLDFSNFLGILVASLLQEDSALLDSGVSLSIEGFDFIFLRFLARFGTPQLALVSDEDEFT